MKYKVIDLDTYLRKDHYLHFRNMNDPFITMSVNLDITKYYENYKKNRYPFFLYIQYAVIEAANSVKELRQRIKDNQIIEYEYCGSSYTVAREDGTYRYCNVLCNMPLDEYFKIAKEKQEKAIRQENLVEEEDPESYFFVSCLPWTSYASLEFPKPDNSFSVPNISWGKYYSENYIDDNGNIQKRYKLPITIMVNHALVDGKHVCDFFNRLADIFNEN